MLADKDDIAERRERANKILKRWDVTMPLYTVEKKRDPFEVAIDSIEES